MRILRSVAFMLVMVAELGQVIFMQKSKSKFVFVAVGAGSMAELAVHHDLWALSSEMSENVII